MLDIKANKHNMQRSYKCLPKISLFLNIELEAYFLLQWVLKYRNENIEKIRTKRYVYI